jgi:hypothetical protein
MALDDALTATRWRRYGKDRLYVNDASGARVGWVDLLTGERHLEDPMRAAAFEAAVSGHLPTEPTTQDEDSAPDDSTAEAAIPGPSNPAPAPEEAPAPADLRSPEGDASAEPGEPMWEDLALRRPGQAAREKALEELASSRERSRFWSFVARAVDAKTDERAWRVGADGEEGVGARLEKLRRHGWHVLHAVPVGERGSDIDHVLVGPGGVYTINTKNHPGGRVWVGRNSVRVNGHPVPYLRNSRHEAVRAARLLSSRLSLNVPVRPAVDHLDRPGVGLTHSGGPAEGAVLHPAES